MFRRTQNVEKSARPKPGRRRWWFIGGLVVLPIIVLGLLLVLLPTIARWALVYSLEQQGYVTRVATMETDLLAGRLSASDIRLRNERMTLSLKQARLTFDWQALLDKQVRVVQVSLKGLSMDSLAEASPSPSGQKSTDPSASQINWLLGLGEFQLRDGRFCQGAGDGRSCLQVERLHWQGETRFDLGKLPSDVPGLPLSVDASLQLEGVTLTKGKQPPLLSLQQLQIGQVRINTLAETTLSGVSGNKLKWTNAISSARLQVEAFQLERISLARRTPPQNSSSNPDAVKLSWGSKFGETTVENSRYCYQSPAGQPCLTVDRLQLQGEAGFATGQKTNSPLEFPLSIDAGLKLAGVMLGEKKSSVLRLRQLQIEQLHLDTPETIRVEQLVAGDFVMPSVSGNNGKQQPDLIRFKKATLSRATLHRLSEVELDRLLINGLAGDIRRQADGQWPIVTQWGGMLPAQAKQSKQSADNVGDTAEQALPPLRLGELRLEQSETLHVSDATLNTPFVLSLQKPALTIGPFDSRQPEQRTSFNLDTVVQEHGQLQLSGWAQPLRDHLFFDLQTTLGAIDLRPATAYLEKYLGYRVKSGQISGKLELAADAGKLDGLADVQLQQFYLEEANQEQASVLTKQLGTPLTASLALLRESDKSINLSVPISGDITDPQFSSGDIFRQLTVRAINEAVKNYYIDYGLALAGVGQYSLAVKGASKLFGFLTRLRFEPVEFTPGEQTLTDSDKRYLDKLATMLTERPEVHLTLCGFTTPQDEPFVNSAVDVGPSPSAQTDTLLALANQRATNVKNYLVNQKAIDPQRLIVCEGQHEAETDRPPRVEINI